MSTLSHSAVLGLIAVPVSEPAYSMPTLAAEPMQQRDALPPSNEWHTPVASIARLMGRKLSLIFRRP
jgi:hypothetical protein